MIEEYDYSKLDFQKLEQIARSQGKMISALESRLEDLYEFVERQENVYMKGAEVIEYLNKLTYRYPIVLGKEK